MLRGLLSLHAAAGRPELDAMHYTEDQPLTPEEQFVVMHSHQEEMNKREKSPSGNDREVFTVHFHLESSSGTRCIVGTRSVNSLLKWR